MSALTFTSRSGGSTRSSWVRFGPSHTRLSLPWQYDFFHFLHYNCQYVSHLHGVRTWLSYPEDD